LGRQWPDGPGSPMAGRPLFACQICGDLVPRSLPPVQGVIEMTGMMRVPRSRGAFCGLLLILLGAWGALVPFVGPHFHYAYTPDTSWTYTSGRLVLEILLGAATVLGGLIVMSSKFRPMAMFGAWLAALSGVWFVVGGPLSALWTHGGAAGSP